MSRNYEYLKDEFLEAAEANREVLELRSTNQYSPKMLVALKEMASHTVYPDGRFSDMDVSIWELFRW